MQLQTGWRRIGRKGVVLAASLLIGVSAWAQDIVVGQVGPFTVLPVPDAKEVNEGLRAHFTQVNARGGVNGRKIALFELDDQYAPDTFVQRFNEALQRKPVALVSPIGSASIKRMLDDKLLDAADVVVLNAIPGAESLRNPGHPKLFHIRAGDRQQIEKIVRHARTLGISRMAVLHQDIPLGSSGLAVAKAVASADGKMEVRGFESTAEEASLVEAARKVAAAGAQSVIVLGSPKYMADGLSQLRKAGVSQSVFTLSYMPAGLAVKSAGEAAARGVGIAQTYPNPMGVNLALHRDFQAAMKAAHPTLAGYTVFHLEGYLTARLLTEALQRTREATPEALARTLRSQPWDLGGFMVDFTKGNIGSQYVDIGVVTSGGRLMY